MRKIRKQTYAEVNLITNFAANACKSILGISFTVALFRALFAYTTYNKAFYTKETITKISQKEITT